MNTPERTRKVKSALGLDDLSTPQMLANAQHYVQQLTGNAYFPSPMPPLAAITAQVSVLDAAYNLSLTRTRGMVTAMHLERKVLHTQLTLLAGYVESVSNSDPANAKKIFASSGIPEKREPALSPKIFTARNGKLKGTAIIDCKAERGATYIYQMTTDITKPGSWANIYIGGKVIFTMTGLVSGTRYFFRMAKSVKGIQGDWSDSIVLFIL
jgi:hypothetical protein